MLGLGRQGEVFAIVEISMEKTEIEQLPVLPVDRSGCGGCVAACCRAEMIMRLNGEEATALEAAGTVLKAMIPAQEGVNPRTEHPDRKNGFLQRVLKMGKYGDGDGMYYLESDCGNLLENEIGQMVCRIHEEPELPRFCQEFSAGSPVCSSLKDKLMGERAMALEAQYTPIEMLQV